MFLFLLFHECVFLCLDFNAHSFGSVYFFSGKKLIPHCGAEDLRFQINLSGKLHCRDGLVWTVGLTVEIKLCFQIFRFGEVRTAEAFESVT